MSKCDPMSKTSEAVVFSAYVPFVLFNTGMYASKYDRSEVQLVRYENASSEAQKPYSPAQVASWLSNHQNVLYP